mgnify:CR=1 FL=1
MGTRGREIVGMDVDQLLVFLKKAYADEWLAYYQYWIGAKLAKGPLRGDLVAEMEQHAQEELNHALLLADRIIQLGGSPPLCPTDWSNESNCGYEAPENPVVYTLIDQNIRAEQCAIDVYNTIAGVTKDTDPMTYQIALQILTDEIEHEEDLQALKEDLTILQTSE